MNSALPARVIATAGHVDHGKSTLVRALTGTNPDRLAEEKARGLTIDLGFAFAEIGGFSVGFVDVPGHVRFLKNMLAGVGAVEVALLVVAANEGWMPQTEEHTQILELLGVRHGVVVLTKAGIVDADTLEFAQLELSERFTNTPFAQWPVIPIDSPTGLGLDEIRSAIATALRDAPAPADRHRARVWVDRTFAAKGAGTVITGTLTGGSIAVDDELLVVANQRLVRVRGLQSGHERVERAQPGTRVAVNLAGIEHHEITRGDGLVTATGWRATTAVDVVFTPTPAAPQLPRTASLTAHIGSGEQPVRWRSFEQSGTDGSRLYGRIRLSAPVALQPGDHFILRSSARRVVVGGAEVVDIAPPRTAAAALVRKDLTPLLRALDAEPWASLESIVELGGFDPTTVSEMCEAAILDGSVVMAHGRHIAAASAHAMKLKVVAAVSAFHISNPTAIGMALSELATTVSVETNLLRELIGAENALKIDRDIVRSADRIAVASQTPEGTAFLAALTETPFAPPSPEAVHVPIAIAKQLVREKIVVEIDGIYFASAAITEAAAIIGRAVIDQGSLTLSEIRDLLGSTRKYVLPIAKTLDQQGVTRRRGDDRIPGPRAI